jgi:hypothetical protein
MVTLIYSRQTKKINSKSRRRSWYYSEQKDSGNIKKIKRHAKNSEW